MKVAILHEGKTKDSLDSGTVEKLLEIQGIPEDRVLFFGLKSKSNFFKPDYEVYRRLLPQIETGQIDKVLFVVDADSAAADAKYGGYENSVAELVSIADQLNVTGISEFHIFCNPDTREGNIESLLLSTLDPEKQACINHFLECSNFKDKEKSKAILHQICKVAYPEPPYDYQHANFDDLKQKLAGLFE